jgi:hypothetical protein
MVDSVGGESVVSRVRVEYLDPKGETRVFSSTRVYHHAREADLDARVPYKRGQEIEVFIDPENFAQADLAYSPWRHFLMSALLLAVAGYFVAFT